MNDLTDSDIANMDVFIEAVLDAYKDGNLDKVQAVNRIAHVISAIDQGNIEEARGWFRQGRKLIQKYFKKT
jgi:hypothetical protein